ncbi:MAG: cytochrome c biogenesis protein CcsA [Prevotella sp.]
MNNRLLDYAVASLYLLLIAVMGTATVIERYHGTEYTHQWVYDAPWFAALWALLAVCGSLYLWRWWRLHGLEGKGKGRDKASALAVLLLHAAWVVILVGGGITRSCALQGMVHLRENEPTDKIELLKPEGEEEHTLPFRIALTGFHIDYHPGTRHPSDYHSHIAIAQRKEVGNGIIDTADISMNHIYKHRGYRFYQADYDRDMGGSLLAVTRDPWGIGVTYAGYTLLLAAILLMAYTHRKRWNGQCQRTGSNTTLKRVHLLAWMLCTLYLLVRWIRGGTAPLTNGFETLLVLSWAILLVGLKRRAHLSSMLLATLFLLAAHLLEPHPATVSPLMPVLRSGLLYVHVSVIILAYALLTLCTVHSFVAWWRKDKDRQQQSSSLLLPAMALLAVGIFIGAVWANQSWGTYWSWDPKEVWALITLMVYAVALHRRSIPFLQHPRNYHLFICLAYLCLLITYFGVNYFLGGMHAYA